MASGFWDSEGVIHVDFLPRGVTIRPQCYGNLLHSGVNQAIWKKRPGKLSKKTILLRVNACSHMASFVKVTLATVGKEIMLGPSDFHLFESMKAHLGVQIFQTED
jgi:hypothetical protein